MALDVPPRAACDVEPRRDAVHVLPVGELDIAIAPTVDTRLHELRDAGFRRLVIDLRQVTFMDVRGLRVILHWADAARGDDGMVAFEVIPGPPHVQRIFDLTATRDRVVFVEDETLRRRFRRSR